MNDEILVPLGERSYRIRFGCGILPETGTICSHLKMGPTVAVVTNHTVAPLYFETVRDSLSDAGFRVHRVEVPDGEQYKNSDTLNFIYGSLIEAGLDRSSFVAALGGGVVGDMAGYAAATYLRGIPFIQIPTTLLAQVDSSVGGKTGINHERGKNLIGAFHQPAAVVIDVAALASLPEREYLAGLAEVVKYGVTLDRELFQYLEENVGWLMARDRECMQRIVFRSCQLKAEMVVQDEREKGLRAVLNYGHTFGHAVETLTGYRRYLHGEAVAIGMVQAARIADMMGLSTLADTERIVSLLERMELPVQLPQFSADDYSDALMHDKKVRERGLSFIFNRGIGDFSIETISDVPSLVKMVI